MSNSLINITRTIIMLCITIMPLTANFAFAEFDTDPFYDRRGRLGAPTYDSISENIDPFSGNMLIVHSDLHLPGKGGLDLNLMRSYNSLIYGRRDNSFPTFVAAYEKSTLGPGWSLHMGILRSPPCMTCVNYPAYMTWGNNPVFELPDGTKQIFYPAVSDVTKMVSKDFWQLKTISIGFNNAGKWQITAPDGTVYVVSNSDANAGYSLGNTTIPAAPMIMSTMTATAVTTPVATSTSGPALIRGKDSSDNKHKHRHGDDRDRDDDHDQHEEIRDGQSEH